MYPFEVSAWRRGQVRGRGRGQGNFKLAANFGYNSRGSADPRESLRKCWISSVLRAPAEGCLFFYVRPAGSAYWQGG